MIKQLDVSHSTAVKDIPVIIVAGLVAVAVVLDGTLSNIDGVFLLVILISYLIWAAKKSANNDNLDLSSDTTDDELLENNSGASKSLLIAGLLTALSIVLLVIASRMLVYGAIEIATLLNINELIIGLTVIAIGTSLPELAAAIAAARKGAHQMIIGNIIGSNVFNILGVLGITGTIQATQIELDALSRDFPIMFFFSILMLIFALTKGRLSRPEGAILLITYIVYICYLAITTLQ